MLSKFVNIKYLRSTKDFMIGWRNTRPKSIFKVLTEARSSAVISKLHQKDPCVAAGGGFKSRHDIKYQPYEAPCPEDHDAKNMRLKRPMSPHLTIYGPTLTAMTSIAQRISGIMLVGYYSLLAAGALLLTDGIDTYISLIQGLNLSETMVICIKFIIAFTFWYHYMNGLRFCIWNLAKMLDLKTVYLTGYLALGAAIATSAALAVMT
ncbi:succinate dehydrogenase cytochrome b560 subunit, mitochondrial [Plutella xylostella]|uniref:succinate dehydrogenase cytochrome b560 subunit, mitochondrial n=1 Tax=Plutella xylostella TaxID=51655 RepID=UPI002032FDBC|nr:succinate dehydrogenase cytochrome b560 subunit, mitochondrial [Plutella xylostella]